MNFSEGFLESIILLILTASLTGFLIPYILKRIDERRLKEQKEVDDRKLKEQKEVDARRLREQKEFEADLARQSKVIESQVQLLENLAKLLWEYQLGAIAVSYYKFDRQHDLYIKAVGEYQSRAGTLFSQIRAEISKALRLTTKETYQELIDLYYHQLLPLDSELEQLIIKQEASERRIDGWHEFNKYAVYDLADLVDNTLNNLAKELRLKDRDSSTSNE